MKILYFSTVNWKWIKQRPHFICEYLSKKEIEITYFSITPFLKQKIFRQKMNKFLYVNDRFVLPYSSKINIIKKINIIYIRLILNRKYDLVILTHPEQYEYLPKYLRKNAKIIYECIDNIPYFYKEKKIEEVKEKEKRLCINVEKIITSSIYLKNKIIKEYSIPSNKVEVIKNALDMSIINKVEGTVKLKAPNLVYIGTISEWVDINILIRFAKENTNYTIYLIGPVDKKIMNESIKNIIFLGVIKHEEVKKYIQAGDIMLIPFKVNELIKGVDPVKLYEYLALNKPVITSYWDELEEYRSNEMINFYNSYKQFVEAVDKIKNNFNMSHANNMKFIEQNSWEKRTEYYVKILETIK